MRTSVIPGAALCGLLVLLDGADKRTWAETASQAPAQQSSTNSTESGEKSPKESVTVTYTGKELTVQAEKVDMVQLLKRVAAAAGLPIEIGEGVSGTVSVSFTKLPLEQGISRILEAYGDKNLVVQYAKRESAGTDMLQIEKISILRSGTARSLGITATERRAALEAREKEYRDFFDKMDRQKNKIARAIKEYQDPGTSGWQRGRIQHFLRGTSIDTPEDKQVLKAALLQIGLNQPLAADVQMALMHAIQDNPQESDKDYIFNLLEKGDYRIGWLYQAMLFAWDTRYVPHLMKQARSGSDISIETLGRMEVKEALPLLEDIIQKRIPVNDYAWREACSSWFRITGTYYPRERLPKR